MTHNTTVTAGVFAALQGRQRHLIVKHDPLFMPKDTLLVSEPDSREQLTFEIVSISQENINQKGGLSLLGLYAPENINQKGGLSLLGLYAPYGSVDDLPETVG